MQIPELVSDIPRTWMRYLWKCLNLCPICVFQSISVCYFCIVSTLPFTCHSPKQTPKAPNYHRHNAVLHHHRLQLRNSIRSNLSARFVSIDELRWRQICQGCLHKHLCRRVQNVHGQCMYHRKIDCHACSIGRPIQGI